MKRLLYILFLLPILLASCILNLEDYTLPEEEQGFDEPMVEENEFGTVSYQYYEDVIHITDNLQDYLERVEDDSILYFNTSMPKKYRPEVGKKLATGISHKLPYGLNHEVLSVDNVGGLLRVVCARTSFEEVYKELDYCIDKSIGYRDLSDMDSTELAEAGFELIDSMYVDWRTYDRIRGLKKTKTRADDEEIPDTTIKEEDTSWPFIEFSLNTNDLKYLNLGKGAAAKALWKVSENMKNTLWNVATLPEDKKAYAEISVSLTHNVTVHTERRQSDKYELNYTDTQNEFAVTLKVGAEKTVSPSSTTNEDFQKQLFESIVRKENVPKKLVSEKPTWSNAKIRVIIPCAVPIAFIASANLSPEFSFGGSISATLTSKTAVTRSGEEIIKGKKREIHEKIGQSSHKLDVVGEGHLKVGAGFRAAAGIEFAGTVGVTVGANVKAFLEGEVNFNASEAISEAMGDDAEKATVLDNFGGKFKFYVDAYGDLQLHVAPLGIELWSKEVAKFLTIHLIDASFKYAPTFTITHATALDSEGITYVDAYYSFRDLDGVNAFFKVNTFYPQMRLYFGPVKKNKWVYMHLIDEAGNQISLNQAGEAKESKVYYFKYFGTFDKDISELHVMPTLCSYYFKWSSDFEEKHEKYVKNEIKCEDNEQLVEIGNPQISTETSFQTYGDAVSEFDFSFFDDFNGYVDSENGASSQTSIDPATLREYKFMTKVYVRNGSRMKNWGIKVRLYTPEGKELLSKKVPCNKAFSGAYTFIFSFVTNWKQKASGEVMYYRVTPYWTDSNGGAQYNAKDSKSTSKHELEYTCDDVTNALMQNKDGEWGSIQPVVDLN